MQPFDWSQYFGSVDVLSYTTDVYQGVLLGVGPVAAIFIVVRFGREIVSTVRGVLGL